MHVGTYKMNRLRLPILIFVAVVAASTSAKTTLADDSAPATIRRFALIAGANDGGPKRVRLRYANNDAKSMLKVLRKRTPSF